MKRFSNLDYPNYPSTPSYLPKLPNKDLGPNDPTQRVWIDPNDFITGPTDF